MLISNASFRTDGGHSGGREQAAGFDPDPTFMIDPSE
jgi:hypothetical protein